MDFFYIASIFFFTFGAILGSFLNVVILRYAEKRTLGGRSACMVCKTILKPIELIPILSYVLQRGLCRTCKTPISAQYPLVEFLTGLCVWGLFLLFGIPGSFVAILVFSMHIAVVALLIVLLVYDIHHKLLPNIFVYPFAGLAFLLMFVSLQGGNVTFITPTLSHLLAGPVLFAPFFGLWYYSKGQWIGLGDGKLAIGMGWMLGMTGGISAVMLGFWIGAVVSLLILLFQRVGTSRLRGIRNNFTMKSEIPFGPFLLLGYALVFYFGFDVVQSLVL